MFFAISFFAKKKKNSLSSSSAEIEVATSNLNTTAVVCADNVLACLSNSAADVVFNCGILNDVKSFLACGLLVLECQNQIFEDLGGVLKVNIFLFEVSLVGSLVSLTLLDVGLCVQYLLLCCAELFVCLFERSCESDDVVLRSLDISLEISLSLLLSSCLLCDVDFKVTLNLEQQLLNLCDGILINKLVGAE